MDVQIQDSTGSGRGLKIDSENRAVTFSITEVEDKFENRKGLQWSLPFSVTPVGANDCFFIIENTGLEDLAITDVRLMSASAETVDYYWVTGTPSYVVGVDIDPVPKNGASSFVPDATVKYDTNITGVTKKGGYIYFQRLDTANKMNKISTSSNIIIPQGTKFTLWARTGGVNIEGVVSLVRLL